MSFALMWIATALAQAEPRSKTEKAKAGPSGFLSRDEVTTILSDRFEAGKTAVFRSRDGKFYGMDSDSVISLEKDNKAVVGEYGYAYQGYRGSYAVAEDGVISISLKGYRGKWPEMKMAKEKNTIRLYAKNNDDGFVFGGRSGAVETEEMKPFWPFRLVETDATPNVTPIWSGGDIKSFTSPTLPEDFEWKGDQIEFRVDFTTQTDGKASVRNHWPTFDEKDWRLPAAKAAQVIREPHCALVFPEP